MKSEIEINDMIDKVANKMDDIAKGESEGCYSMTYEDGVKCTLEWVMEYIDEEPIEE